MVADYASGRRRMLDALKAELVGPAPTGSPLDVSVGMVHFESLEAANGPWVDALSGEEILQRDPPTKRYGVGVLYPTRSRTSDDDVDPQAAELAETPEPEPRAMVPGEAGRPAAPSEAPTRDPDTDDFDLSMSSGYRPSAMAITFLFDAGSSSSLKVEATGGRYAPIRVTIAGMTDRTWWVRRPVTMSAYFDSTSLMKSLQPHFVEAVVTAATDPCPVEVKAYSRPRPDEGKALVTVFLVNRNPTSRRADDELCLFQSHLVVTAEKAGGVLPYPRDAAAVPDDREEERSFQLLYRNTRTFGIGHGCAADWGGERGDSAATWVSAEPLPCHEVPSISPDVVVGDRRVTVSMARLAGLDEGSGGLNEAETVLDMYRGWIAARRDEVPGIDDQLRSAAERHMAECREAADRMEAGLALIRSDETVARAFRLANHAMLLQQLRARPTPRKVTLDAEGRYRMGEPLVVQDWRQVEQRGTWRPFQIAFLLACLPSVASGSHPDRDLVELIWFPTGGGKTEAYLGLSAFAAFYRRLRDRSDDGTEVIMRYTLRLLTTQQFLRAASLACAMEHLRRSDAGSLGDSPFSIGVWLGGGATPNNRSEAKRVLHKLNRGERYQENLFLLLRCPWCSAQMGPVKVDPKAARLGLRTAGYEESGGTVAFCCPDPRCEFNSGLPVFVVDEDIYDARPTMVIGTVDKFALLTWRPEARALFGIDGAGSRTHSPPGTIIQDELHLISGPLGSMVGLYEAVIESLCCDERGAARVRPKIVGSTATIRRYEQQVKALYDRDRVALFPPRGLDASDSFFARYDRDAEGKLSPGRLYVGVHAPGLGSVQTAQVRTFASLLQAPMAMEPDERDPWWSLVSFFNSLRELGTSLSLMQSDIPDYLRVLRHRFGLDARDVRSIRIWKELTSRLRQDEIPRAIDELSRVAGSAEAIDVCLASSIIEVGIDIDRLSLMCVVGQPKSTSQYIQVTGRVGRQWRERPGLIVTIFSPSKPRDRSHFERFRSYHEQLYAQVEPTSVTPFAPPVLDRALHGALCAYVRQSGPDRVAPWPFPEALVEQAVGVLRSRAANIDPAELERLERVIEARIREWTQWERTDWSGSAWAAGGRAPLLRMAGEWVPPEVERVTWATPTSMRNVDAECQLTITSAYAAERGELQ